MQILSEKDGEDLVLNEDQRWKYLFENREQIAQDLDSLVEGHALSFKDIVKLFRYAVNEQGISDTIVTKIMIRYMIKNKAN